MATNPQRGSSSQLTQIPPAGPQSSLELLRESIFHQPGSTGTRQPAGHPYRPGLSELEVEGYMRQKRQPVSKTGDTASFSSQLAAAVIRLNATLRMGGKIHHR